MSRSRSSAPKKAPLCAHHSSSDRVLHDHTTCKQYLPCLTLEVCWPPNS